jgi:hypothetical protein
MEEINAEWLKARVSGDRGLLAELSRQTGISPDKISKILSGIRQVQSHEAPLIYQFFEDAFEPKPDPELEEIQSLWLKLSPEERHFLRNAAKAQIAARDQSHSKSDEDDQ